jgi:hypothetical protein
MSFKKVKNKFLKLNELDFFNVSLDENFRKSRYEKRKDYKVFDEIKLPYNMENLNDSITK